MNTLMRLSRYLESVKNINWVLATILLVMNIGAFAQDKGWGKLELFDNLYTMFYTREYLNDISKGNVAKYPVTNVFDGRLSTCWVLGDTIDSKTSLYLRVPDDIDVSKLILNILAGYGKSKVLFRANARPKKLSISVYEAFIPSGHVSEISAFPVLFEYPRHLSFYLADTIAVQSFPLDLIPDSLSYFFRNSFSKFFQESGEMLRDSSDTSLQPFIVLRLDFEGFYPGTRYGDICVSEIFMNDRFVGKSGFLARNITDVGIKNDNELIARYNDGTQKVITRSDISTFTSVDISGNKQWAILYHVSNDGVGEGSRIEELHSLINLRTFEIIDDEFFQSTGLNPSFLYFSDGKDEDKVVVTDFSTEVELL